MPRTLSYADAVRLLGGKESKAVTWLDRITGAAMLGTAPAVEEVLGWFDAKADLVKHGHDLVNGLSDRVRGLRRFDRTQRLEAAHAVIVTLAFIEAFEALPQRPDRKEIQDGRIGTAELVRQQLTSRVPLPTPQHPYRDNLQALTLYYVLRSGELIEFVRGLAVWDRWNDTERARFSKQATHPLVNQALARYQELFRQLAVECPELGFWANLTEHQGTQELLRSGLAQLEIHLAALATGREPDSRRAELARGYLARLERTLVEPAELPADFRIPTLGEAYIDPLGRVREIHQGDTPSQEPWWEEVPPRQDIQDFLTGYLTSPQAVARPLLVLGQPGSGKSVLTQVLAARLPATDFLPVRVPLREVATEVDVQTQIEQAIRLGTGYRVDWPELANSAGDALPVVLLDGFDELLQTTGVSQSDYLERVRAFQQRESDQGRPVAVLVTTRTSVADRARIPDGCVALRLEPFDEPRVIRWLAHWQASNPGSRFRLTAATASRYPDLATQPLLLLMLAIYDADGGDLSDTRLRESELYERLLRRFARREVGKTRDGLADPDLAAAVEEELRRLSVVAYGMFNRGQQWITEPDLDADLAALLGTRGNPLTGLRTPLGPAETTLGRFFFIHRAESQRDDRRLRTYEFLHATFGEYLVARLTWQALHGLHAMAAAAAANPLAVIPLNDGFPHALLAHTPLSSRRPILSFLAELAEATTPDTRAGLTALLIRLYRAAPEAHPTRSHADYQPRHTTVPAQHAAYRANLLLLTAITARELRASELYGTDDDQPGVVQQWRADALLWRSQLSTDDWTGLVETLALTRTWRGTRRDLEIRLDDGSFTPPPLDLNWSTRRPAAELSPTITGLRYANQAPRVQRRLLHFLCGNEDIHLHVLEPLFDHLSRDYALHPVADGEIRPTLPRALLDLLTLPYREPSTDHAAQYERFIQIAETRPPDPASPDRLAILDLALTLMTSDDQSPTALATDLLAELTRHLFRLPTRASVLEARTLRHALTLLSRPEPPTPALTEPLTRLITDALQNDPTPLAAEALITLLERAPSTDPYLLADLDPETWLTLTATRPDLARRAHNTWQHLNPTDPWPHPAP
ncbi:NACHT domain-containing protein [Crossiella cryophila]|uniref:NACHT N-terminal Helical domain-containing protein n=1 Tax=Crossiella cryophila TaxID=43355 RepID=A0A7W7CIF8_9PSEU|nr:hypothetical protein [Crossiella cryophila]MBB4681776.1 hypothetical protein [Crossiella cryophila]